MHILFIGKCCPLETAHKILLSSQKNPGFQIIKFVHLILDGFRACDSQVSVISNINAPSIGIHEETENKVLYQYVSTLNIPIVCQFLYYLQSFYYTFKWGVRNRKNRIIFCDIFSSSSTVSGGVLAAKILRIPICALVTDMITTPLTTSLNLNNVFWKFFFNIRQNKQYRSLNTYHAFVFLTKYMNEIYNPLKRPYIVMEGSVDSRFVSCQNIKKQTPRVIMYAGAIEKEYGLNELTQAFMSLSIPDIEFHIYGNGKFVKDLLEYQKQDPRIKYMGIVNNADIVKAEQAATLLINPRLSHEVYVKYSFPSKTSEYMLSGTPLLTTKLPGIPDEYFQHLYTFDEESITGFARKMSEILSLPETELIQQGKNAQEFVLKNKNNILQSKRIFEFLKPIIK